MHKFFLFSHFKDVFVKSDTQPGCLSISINESLAKMCVLLL
jgi:hypothetical protein